MENLESEESAFAKFEDHERTKTGNTPLQKLRDVLSLQLQKRNGISTQLLAAVLEEHTPRAIYKTDSTILAHTAITENMRARLRTFIMAECAKQWVFRESCVLACTYFDLFFAKKGTVQVSRLQCLAIACLILACKIRQNIFPKVSYEIFRRTELVELEEKVVRQVGFNLNPPTYYEYAQRLLFAWDLYVEERQMYNVRFGEQKEGINCKLRRFYEHLDCVYMVLASLDFSIEDIALNLFYLHARMHNVYEIENPHSLSKPDFLLYFYPKDDPFLDFYSAFLAFFSQRNLKISPDIGSYLQPFLAIPAAKMKWGISAKEDHLEKIRAWDEVQTLPKDCYVSIKQIIAKMNKQQ